MTSSAKSLFRAISGRATPELSALLPIDLPRQTIPKAARRAEDFYPTGQPEAIRALLARDWTEVPMQMRFMDREDARQGVLI